MAGWLLYRIEPDGSETVVACLDDLAEAGPAILEDRDKIDWEAGYRAVNQEEGEP